MDNKAWAQEVAKKIKEKEIEVIKRSVNKVPYIAKNGVFDDLSETRLGWWTNGFWGGMMWQLYQATKEPHVNHEAQDELVNRISWEVLHNEQNADCKMYFYLEQPDK